MSTRTKRKLPPYTCPRCDYKTDRKSNMGTHLFGNQKTCPSVKNTIVLTNEIKDDIMNNRIHHIVHVFVPQAFVAPKHDVATKLRAGPKNISKKLRYLVWKTYIGDMLEGLCLCCHKSTISAITFVCGHVLAKTNCGPNTIENLRPICSNCNSDMDSMHMFEHMLLIQQHEEGLQNKVVLIDEPSLVSI